MAQLLEYIKMALMNIKGNKGRSILTMLGIIIGISSVIMVISIGNGISEEINGELNNMAGGQLYLYASDESQTGESVAFTMDDFEAIKTGIEHVKGVTPQDSMYGKSNSPKGEFTTFVYSGTEDLQCIFNDPIIKGGYFTKSDYETGNPVCVIREGSALTLFGTTDVIGKTFQVEVLGREVELKIIGIRKDNASAFMNLVGQYDEVELEMPLTSFCIAFEFWVEDFSGFYVVADGPEYASDVAKKAVSMLEARHQVTGRNVVQMQDFNDTMSSITSVIDYVTIFVVFVAAISLLVGGIGVMNIMLVSVTERTREIGIRKALGAKTRSVMTQFLAESAIITLIGGCIGIILGALGAYGVCALLGFAAKVKVSTVLFATFFSSGVGIFFGIYPAKRAAKLSPIEALRHE